MSEKPSFFSEAKRRNVYKVAVGYGVVGWLVIQVTATIIPALHLPDSLTTEVVVLTMLGFPIALTIAWAGDKELALQQLEAGLRAPNASQMLSYGALKRHLLWDPVRGDLIFRLIREFLTEVHHD